MPLLTSHCHALSPMLLPLSNYQWMQTLCGCSDRVTMQEVPELHIMRRSEHPLIPSFEHQPKRRAYPLSPQHTMEQHTSRKATVERGPVSLPGHRGSREKEKG